MKNELKKYKFVIRELKKMLKVYVMSSAEEHDFAAGCMGDLLKRSKSKCQLDNDTCYADCRKCVDRVVRKLLKQEEKK